MQTYSDLQNWKSASPMISSYTPPQTAGDVLNNIFPANNDNILLSLLGGIIKPIAGAGLNVAENIGKLGQGAKIASQKGIDWGGGIDLARAGDPIFMAHQGYKNYQENPLLSTARQQAESVLTGLSMGGSGFGVTNPISTLWGGGSNLLGKIGSKALSGAVGGSTYGLGQDIAEGKPIGDIIKDIPSNFGIGGLTGGVLGTLGMGAGKLGKVIGGKLGTSAEAATEAVTSAESKAAKIQGVMDELNKSPSAGKFGNVPEVGGALEPTQFKNTVIGDPVMAKAGIDSSALRRTAANRWGALMQYGRKLFPNINLGDTTQQAVMTESMLPIWRDNLINQFKNIDFGHIKSPILGRNLEGINPNDALATTTKTILDKALAKIPGAEKDAGIQDALTKNPVIRSAVYGIRDATDFPSLIKNWGDLNRVAGSFNESGEGSSFVKQYLKALREAVGSTLKELNPEAKQTISDMSYMHYAQDGLVKILGSSERVYAPFVGMKLPFKISTVEQGARGRLSNLLNRDIMQNEAGASGAGGAGGVFPGGLAGKGLAGLPGILGVTSRSQQQPGVLSNVATPKFNTAQSASQQDMMNIIGKQQILQMLAAGMKPSDVKIVADLLGFTSSGTTGTMSAAAKKDMLNAKDALNNIDQAIAIINKNPGALFEMNNPIDFLKSADAQKLKALLQNAVDVKTRLRTGAALNIQEQEFYQQFVPNWQDKPESIQNKIQNLIDFYSSYLEPQ